MPCTILNGFIALSGSLLIVAVGWQSLTPIAGLAVGSLFLVLAAGTIYLRGYLIPGTPTLTNRYLPIWVPALFGKASEEATAPASGENVDVEAILLGVGALEECQNRPDLCVTADFRADWQNAVNTLTDAIQTTDASKRSKPSQREYPSTGKFRAYVDGDRTATWQSEAGYLAHMGGAMMLADRDSEWTARSEFERSRILEGLVLFMDWCPACGGQPEFEAKTTESCCSSTQTGARIECVDCGAHLFETKT